MQGEEAVEVKKSKIKAVAEAVRSVIVKLNTALRKLRGTYEQGKALRYINDAKAVHQALVKAYHEVGNKKTASGADGEVRYSANGDAEGKSIKEQIKNSLDVLSEMEPVASIQLIGMGNKTKAEIFSEVLHDIKSKGMTIDKKGFGIITLTEDDINRGLDYVNSDAEYSTYFTIHRVLKRGVVIGEHTDHKNRNMRTVTIGAPIILDGERCNVGIALKAIKGYRYKSLRVVLWDGSKFDAKKETKATTSRMTDVSTGESRDITLASNVSLSQGEADVKGGNLSGEVKFSFAGPSAKTADMSALERAESMEQGKATAENILRETGWYRGIDGKWRFELDDSECSLIDDPKLEKHTYDGETYFTAKLEDILKHDKLFESYPHLRNTNVIIQETDFGTNGISFAKRNEIVLSKRMYEKLTEEYLDIVNNRQKYIAEIEATPEYKKYNSIYDKEFSDAEEWLAEEERLRNEFYSSDLGKRYHSLMWPRKDSSIQMYEPGWSNKAKEVLLHEVQHLIQAEEGFSKGSSTEYWVRKGATIREADDLYHNTAGEIEARDASARMNMTEAERRESMPHRGDGNTVFADDSMISFDEDNKKTAEGADEEIIFSPDENDVKVFSEQVDNWLKGNMPTNGMFELGKTPEVLKKLGVKDLPMVMSQEVIAKVTGGKHDIAIDDIKKLPNLVANPIMVFKSATIDNAFVLLTEIVDKTGNDVIVAMHLNRSEKHVRVNRVASMYGKENIERFVVSQINAGNLKYIDKNKSLSWSQSRGLQLPELADTTRGSINSILTKEYIVNRYYGQNSEMKFSMPADNKKTAEGAVEGEWYSYNSLANHEDMVVTMLTEDVPYKDGKIDKKIVKANAKYNVRSKNNPKNTNENSFVYVKDIDKDILVGTTGLEHGFSSRDEATAKVTMKIGDVLENAIRINELHPRERTDGSYVLIGIATDVDGNYYPTRIVINEYKVGNIEVLGVLYSAKAKRKKNQSPNGARLPANAVPTIKGPSAIKISELLNLVKDNFADVLSENVLKEFGMIRPKSTLSESVKFSMPVPRSQAQYEDRAYKLEKDIRTAIEEKLGNTLSDDSVKAVQGLVDSIAKGDEAKAEAWREVLRDSILRNDMVYYGEADASDDVLSEYFRSMRKNGRLRL